MMAMISYRAPTEFSERFGRDYMPHTNGQAPPFSVESYLRHQGRKLVNRFDANCYVQLTYQMDSHDVGRGRGTYAAALERISQPTLVLGVDSDILYPLAEQEELAAMIPNATLGVLRAPFGHDTFLIELDQIASHVAPFLAQIRSASTPCASCA